MHRRIAFKAAPDALALARLWAVRRERPVVLLRLDPEAAGSSAVTLRDVVRGTDLLARGGLPPLIPLSEDGIGFVALARDPDAARRVTAAEARRALGWLARRYDLVLEGGPRAPLAETARRLAR